MEQDRPDVLKRRREWFEDQVDLEPERLIFIDETWASTNMAGTTAVPGKVNGCAPASRSAIGRPPLSSPVCGSTASWHRW